MREVYVYNEPSKTMPMLIGTVQKQNKLIVRLTVLSVVLGAAVIQQIKAKRALQKELKTLRDQAAEEETENT